MVISFLLLITVNKQSAKSAVAYNRLPSGERQEERKKAKRSGAFRSGWTFFEVTVRSVTDRKRS
jgi:hypothetical protein